jgi:Imidazoleglycerol-phosphate dehydratase
MRISEIDRQTSETDISCTLEIDGSGKYDVDTGCGFLDHMLELFARHGRFDLALRCKGDTHVDYHHTVEDVGIVLGRAFSKSLGNCAGIRRYGSIMLPMDETLVAVALDISGRAWVNFGLDIPSEKVGDFDTELVQEFFISFSRELGAAVHIYQIWGQNSHHIIEAAFKGFGRALAQATEIDPNAAGEIPSTKGTIV